MNRFKKRGATGNRAIMGYIGHPVSGSTGKLPEVRALQASLGLDPVLPASRGGFRGR
jgi:hypothetical protein